MNDLFAESALFDIFTKQALFIEQFKLNEVLLFNDVLAAIEDDFRKNLNKISYVDLSEMKKAQVQNFIKVLRGSQTAIYSKYQRQLLARLQKFTEAVVDQTTIIGGSYLSALETNKDDEEQFVIVPIGLQRSKNLLETEFKENDNSSLNGLFMLLGGAAMLAKFWPILKNSPMPTSGALLINYINTAIASNMMKVTQAVMTGWVNKQTTEELKAQVLGSKSTGEGNPNIPGGSKSSEVTKIRNVMKAVIPTVIQHVSQVSISSVNSVVWKGYKWHSVIDSVTSAICRSLNGKKFQYGAGPLPPAHPQCRSHTAPFVGPASDFTPPDMYSWLIGNNRGFLVGTFKPDVANQLINGEHVATDESVTNKVKPLTVEQFFARTNDLFPSGDAAN